MSTGTNRIEIRNLLNPTPNCTNSLKSAQSSPEPDRSNWKVPIGKEQQEQPHGSRDNVRFIRQGPTKYGIDFDIFSGPECASSQLVPVARPYSPSSNLILRKGDEQNCKDSNVNSHIQSSLDNMRALRVAELVNDYRSLIIQIMERIGSIPLGDVTQDGYRVLQQNHAAAQRLLAGNCRPAVSNLGEEDQTAQFRRIILDASARRHQAHKIYLRVAAAERWVSNLDYVVRKFSPHELAAQLRNIDGILHNEIINTSDQLVASELSDADTWAGYWVNEDPSLTSIQLWTRLELWHQCD